MNKETMTEKIKSAYKKKWEALLAKYPNPTMDENRLFRAEERKLLAFAKLACDGSRGVRFEDVIKVD